MIENFYMLLIVNQLNQFFDEKTKIAKISINIELLTMQIKLNIIIKNQFKSAAKFKTTKTTQNFKKSSLAINFIKSLQIKSSKYEIFKLIKIFSNFNSIKSLIVSMIFIITIKHTATNEES